MLCPASIAGSGYERFHPSNCCHEPRGNRRRLPSKRPGAAAAPGGERDRAGARDADAAGRGRAVRAAQSHGMHHRACQAEPEGEPPSQRVRRLGRASIGGGVLMLFGGERQAESEKAVVRADAELETEMAEIDAMLESPSAWLTPRCRSALLAA